MTISFKQFVWPVLAISLLTLTSCNDHSTATESVALGNGEMRTFINFAAQDKPKEVGIEISAAAFENLPTTASDGRWDILDQDGKIVAHCCGHELTLPLAEGIEKTAFKHIVANWNPSGHAPDGIFHLPHFDFHFYTISEEERESIAAPKAEERCMVPGPGDVLQPVPLDCATYAKAVKPLPAKYMPVGYIDVGAVEPAMGNHLLDPAAPALNGVTFTHTWIWGTWNGGIAFHEPMITLAYLKSLRDDKLNSHCESIGMPLRMEQANWHPTRYCMRYLEKRDVFTVTLEDWQWFDT